MPFKLKKGICACCDTKDVLIVYTSGKLCYECNRARLIAKRKPMKKGKRTTGEKDLFIQIWAERPHLCVNCKKNLGDEPRTFFFSHIQSKGAHPEKRLDKTNIQLLCFDCHREYDQGTRLKFELRSFEVQVTSAPATSSPPKDNHQASA